MHTTVYTREGKSRQGETNGQEDVEEGKEDSTDQALDAASRTQPPLNFRVRARPHPGAPWLNPDWFPAKVERLQNRNSVRCRRGEEIQMTGKP